LDYQQGRSQRGNEADAAEGITQDGAADVNEKRNEGWLVDIAPGHVIAAGDVVELIAKVAVAVVEVDVEEQFGESDGPDDGHALSQEAEWAVGCGGGGRRAGHGGEEYPKGRGDAIGQKPR
jgi:hypothetical protein